MARTLIDVDDEALATAQRYFGTTTKVATVNAALHLAAETAARREAVLEELTVGAQIYARLLEDESSDPVV